MKYLILFLVCSYALLAAEINKFEVATLKCLYGPRKGQTLVISNVFAFKNCGDQTICLVLKYLKDGKTNTFHTYDAFSIELHPQ